MTKKPGVDFSVSKHDTCISPVSAEARVYALVALQSRSSRGLGTVFWEAKVGWDRVLASAARVQHVGSQTTVHSE